MCNVIDLLHGINFVFRFGEEHSVLQQRLGSMLICIFAEVEEAGIDRHLHKFLPVLYNNLQVVTKNPDTGV